MTMLSNARLLLHPGRRLHDGHPQKRRALAPVCLFGVCDAVDAERVYHREMDKERRRLATYELVDDAQRTPSSVGEPEQRDLDERNPLTEVVGEGNRREATLTVATTTSESANRDERTPSTAGGRVTKRRQIKITDLWSKSKMRAQVVVGDVKKRTSGVAKQATSPC